MNTLNSKGLVGIMLFGLLVGSNGCMTQSTIQNARGHPEKAWIRSDPNTIPDPTQPKPAYYALVPLTVPADIITSPVQLVAFGFYAAAMSNFGHQCGN
jgi:hypothetical protein